jgi:hypothetical protein
MELAGRWITTVILLQIVSNYSVLDFKMENRSDTGTEDQEWRFDMSKEMPTLVVTDPWLLWLFKHGWEDPDWGKRPTDQVTIAIAIHELATKIADEEMRKQIQGSAARLMVNTAQVVVKESQSGV